MDKSRQPWELASLGTQTIADHAAPRFPPPPLAPIRDRGAHRPAAAAARVGPPQNPRASPPRFSCDSDDTSACSDAGSPPQARGLRPPPPRPRIPRIPGSSPADQKEKESISPLLSGAPPPPPSGVNLAPPTKADVPPDTPTTSPNDDDDDVIPDEHKRIPGLIPRSPLSPLRDFMERRGRKPVPPSIVIHHPPRNYAVREVKSPAVESATATIVVPSPGALPATPAAQARPKRRTVWGIIEGWWDLGLLERMNTVRRKK
ncbi:hypothetical protein VTK56DRAFT_2976 [Thermocarpiscus australiensis]